MQGMFLRGVFHLAREFVWTSQVTHALPALQVGLPPAVVGTGWSLMCLAVAVAEPLIGIGIDSIRYATFSHAQLKHVSD
jgi:hypothetical protein